MATCCPATATCQSFIPVCQLSSREKNLSKNLYVKGIFISDGAYCLGYILGYSFVLAESCDPVLTNRTPEKMLID